MRDRPGSAVLDQYKAESCGLAPACETVPIPALTEFPTTVPTRPRSRLNSIRSLQASSDRSIIAAVEFCELCGLFSSSGESPMKKLFEVSLVKHCCAFGVALLVGIVVGCGGGSSETPSTNAGNKGSSSQAGSSTSGGAASSSSGSKTADEPPTVDGIPLNVYFDNPLAEASDQRLLAGGPATTPTPGPSPGTSPPAEMKPEPKPDAGGGAAGAVAWNDLITSEQIDGEAKSIQNELRSRLTNVGAYNRSYLEIPVFSSTLGLLAEVALRHPQDVPWKANAKYVRALTVSMAEITGGASAKGPKSYEEVNRAFETISDIFSGNAPAEPPEAEDEIDLADAADFGYLMKQLERESQWLQTETGTEDGLKSKADLAKRNVAVLAVIAQAFRATGYGYDEDPDFLEHADAMRDAALGMGKAVETSFETFDTLRSKVSQKCTECHSVYRNG
jgi:hypothetical protein